MGMRITLLNEYMDINRHPEDKTDKRHKLIYLEHEYKPFNLRKLIGQ